MPRRRSIFVDAGLHHDFKGACHAEHTTMAAVVDAEVRRWLEDKFAIETNGDETVAANRTKNIMLDDGLHLKLKSACVRKRHTMTKVVESLVRDWLEKREPKEGQDEAS